MLEGDASKYASAMKIEKNARIYTEHQAIWEARGTL